MLRQGVRVKLNVCFRTTMLAQREDSELGPQRQDTFRDWEQFADFVNHMNMQGYGLVVECWGYEL